MKCSFPNGQSGLFDPQFLPENAWPTPHENGATVMTIVLTDGEQRQVWRPNWGKVRQEV